MTGDNYTLLDIDFSADGTVEFIITEIEDCDLANQV